MESIINLILQNISDKKYLHASKNIKMMKNIKAGQLGIKPVQVAPKMLEQYCETPDGLFSVIYWCTDRDYQGSLVVFDKIASLLDENGIVCSLFYAPYFYNVFLHLRTRPDLEVFCIELPNGNPAAFIRKADNGERLDLAEEEIVAAKNKYLSNKRSDFRIADLDDDTRRYLNIKSTQYLIERNFGKAYLISDTLKAVFGNDFTKSQA